MVFAENQRCEMMIIVMMRGGLGGRAELTLWKYPNMSRLAELTGHTSRVLHLAQSPDGPSRVPCAGFVNQVTPYALFGPKKCDLIYETLLSLGRPIPSYYYKNYYKNACSECMPAIPIVIPI